MTPEERLKQNLAAYMARMGMVGDNGVRGLDVNAPPITMDSQVEKLVNAPMSNAMMSGYIDQAEAAKQQSDLDARSQDLTGMENKIKSQRAYAESLRGREMPKGRSVGPLDVYVQPNWGETLQGALNPVIGGLVNRAANRDEAETSTKRSALNKAQAKYDAEVLERQEVRKDRTLDEQITSGLRDDATKRELSAAEIAAREAARLASAQDARSLARLNNSFDVEGDARGLNNAIAQDWKLEPFLNMATGKPEMVGYNPNLPGEKFIGGQGGEAVDPVTFGKNYTTYVAPDNTGTMGDLTKWQSDDAKAERERLWTDEVNYNQTLDHINFVTKQMGRVVNSPDLKGSTGMTNLGAYANMLGVGKDAAKTQAFSKQLQDAQWSRFAELAQIFRPLSEKEGVKIDKALAARTDEPEAILNVFATQGLDLVEESYRDALRNASNPAHKENLTKAFNTAKTALQMDLAKSALELGITPEDAHMVDMSPEELSTWYAMIKKPQ